MNVIFDILYREVMKAYPDAKAILSVRDPVKWYHSVKNTIYQSRTMGKDPLVRLYCKVIGLWSSWDCALQNAKGTEQLFLIFF